MIGQQLLKINISGQISTNGSNDINGWRETLQTTFHLLPCFRIGRKRISVQIRFWLNSKRLDGSKNDLDNLVKPILDTMQKKEYIKNDSDVFHLDVSKHPTDGEQTLDLSVYEWVE